ncbi:MAG TPA: PHP domain-containing protein [Methanobacteriaceae archaeon]|nr:PHP domain-containing protein [Methanobacteriaceae archaeon]
MKNIFSPARNLLTEVPKEEFHIHTVYSDGKNTIEEYVSKALKERFTSICFTEHVDFTTDWFDRYHDNIRRVNDCESLNVYCGIEVRAKDYQGQLNADKYLLRESDILMGVIHRIPSEDGLDACEARFIPPEDVLELEYRATMGLLKSNEIDILGHPMSNYEKNFKEAPIDCYQKIFHMARKKDVAVELNPKYHRNFAEVLKLTLEVNPLVSLGSNAHLVSEFGRSFTKVSELVE